LSGNFIEREKAALVIIDIQEKLFPYVKDQIILQRNVSKLAETAKLLDVPVIVTEHYPKGLGRTIPSVANLVKEAKKIEKTSFGCCGDEKFNKAVKKTDRKQIIICGVETHICVAQTAMGLKNGGYDVYLSGDAVSSRNETDAETAIERMRGEGIIISTTEALMYELMRDASDPLFKEFLKIVKI